MAEQKTEFSYEKLGQCLLDTAEPIAKRTRALFYLRTKGGVKAVEYIGKAVLLASQLNIRSTGAALQNESDSALLRHELAYVLGQIGLEDACGVLEAVLANVGDDSMVRHEAAEALGAIGSESSAEILQKFASDPLPEVAETCEIALDLIKWRKSRGKNISGGRVGEDEEPEGEKEVRRKESQDEGSGKPQDSTTEAAEEEGEVSSKFLSVDPAPPVKGEKSTAELLGVYMDRALPLFQRYRAMFSLRNRGKEEDVLALAEGFKDGSALFRHEVAYVLGQLAHPASVDSLTKVLMDADEHRMVRHEAAEALGAVGTKKCEEVLESYRQDREPVVRESCEVALDIIDYWDTPGESLH